MSLTHAHSHTTHSYVIHTRMSHIHKHTHTLHIQMPHTHSTHMLPTHTQTPSQQAVALKMQTPQKHTESREHSRRHSRLTPAALSCRSCTSHSTHPAVSHPSPPKLLPRETGCTWHSFPEGLAAADEPCEGFVGGCCHVAMPTTPAAWRGAGLEGAGAHQT